MPPPQPEPLALRQRLANMRPYQLSLNYLRNNYVFVSYLAFFFLMNVALFIARIVEYWDHNIFVKFARASGKLCTDTIVNTYNYYGTVNIYDLQTLTAPCQLVIAYFGAITTPATASAISWRLFDPS